MICSTNNNTIFAYLPIFLFIFSATSTLITYAISLGSHHVDEVPFVSETGGIPPESCIFTFAMNIIGVTLMLNVYVRYNLVLLWNTQNHTVTVVNRMALFAGFISAIGVIIAGDFSVVASLWVHNIGAFFAFFIGGGYTLLQTVITFHTRPRFSTTRLFLIQSAIVIGLFITGVAMSVSVRVSMLENHKKWLDPPILWTPNEEGFAARVVAASVEWILVGLFVTFFLTFVPGFRRIDAKFKFHLLAPGGEEDGDGDSSGTQRDVVTDNAETVRLSLDTSENTA